MGIEITCRLSRGGAAYMLYFSDRKYASAAPILLFLQRVLHESVMWSTCTANSMKEAPSRSNQPISTSSEPPPKFKFAILPVYVFASAIGQAEEECCCCCCRCCETDSASGRGVAVHWQGAMGVWVQPSDGDGALHPGSGCH